MASYVRTADFWRQDLEQRDFEHEIAAFLERHKVEYRDQTQDVDRPDFAVKWMAPGKELRVAVEAKEKRQHYRAAWVTESHGIAENDLLLVDEVAVRKLLLHAPAAFLLFRDMVGDEGRYVVYSLLDLFCLPRRRVNRPINRTARQIKGKWLLSKRDGQRFPDLPSAFRYMRVYALFRLHDQLFTLPCHGDYFGETIRTLE